MARVNSVAFWEDVLPAVGSHVHDRAHVHAAAIGARRQGREWMILARKTRA